MMHLTRQAAAEVDTTLGFELIGVFLANILYGISCLQTFNYFLKFGNDRIGLKVYVATVFFLDTAQIGLVCYTIYWYIIKNFGNGFASVSVNPALTTSLVLGDILMYIVPLFFIHRLFTVSGKRYIIVIPAILLTSASFCLESYFRIQSFIHPFYPDLQKFFHVIDAGFGCHILGDISYTFLLCLVLHKSDPQFKYLKSVVRRVMAYAINTSLLCCMVTALGFGFYIGQPRTYASLIAFIPVSKLYVNCMLAALNAREVLRDSSRFQYTKTSHIAFSRQQESTAQSNIMLSPVGKESSSGRSIYSQESKAYEV